GAKGIVNLRVLGSTWSWRSDRPGWMISSALASCYASASSRSLSGCTRDARPPGELDLEVPRHAALGDHCSNLSVQPHTESDLHFVRLAGHCTELRQCHGCGVAHLTEGRLESRPGV